MNSDEELCKKLLKLNINLSDTLNIYFTYKKVKNGCYVNIFKNFNKFENILIEYKLKYKKYDSDKYFISKKIDPTNIIFIDENNNFNDKNIGKFLGYGCVYDMNKDKPCIKGFLLNINYINDKQTHVYGFCCLKLNINIINNTLEIVHKMNYYMKKYLSNFLKRGYFVLQISKLSDYTSHKSY